MWKATLTSRLAKRPLALARPSWIAIEQDRVNTPQREVQGYVANLWNAAGKVTERNGAVVAPDIEVACERIECHKYIGGTAGACERAVGREHGDPWNGCDRIPTHAVASGIVKRVNLRAGREWP